MASVPSGSEPESASSYKPRYIDVRAYVYHPTQMWRLSLTYT